ncbi:MAG: HAMP domain-containing sensor histidine kinase [Melioribacteraceae bacterium]|nr:HAMP domain-containing sensor histidine kinase [Melioribacteraceae bacterium]
MNLNPISFIRKSVFIKILLIIFGLGFLINVLVFGFFKTYYEKHIEKGLHENFKNYFEYIASDIGSPPDTILAKSISEKYSLVIWYKSKILNWSSIDSSSKIHSRRILRPLEGETGFTKDSTFIINNTDGSQFIFWGDFRQNIRPNHSFLIHLLLILSTLIALAYFLVRSIFKPVKLLSSGVEEVSKGNLEAFIKVNSKDELGKLAHSFNSMTVRIKEMLKSRDQLLLDVSHELRSPLTRIKMALEFVEDGNKKTSIENDVKEIELMISEILETERLNVGHGKLQLEEYDLQDILEEIIIDYADRKPGVNFQKVNHQIILELDIERIKIVFRNIIENAIRYSKTDSNPVEISIIDKKELVEVRIKDDGIGIPKEQLSNIFEPFYRVDTSRSKKTGGYGLGLSLCKKIMDAHKGSIEIENNTEGGVTVCLEFPKNSK